VEKYSCDWEVTGGNRAVGGRPGGRPKRQGCADSGTAHLPNGSREGICGGHSRTPVRILRVGEWPQSRRGREIARDAGPELGVPFPESNGRRVRRHRREELAADDLEVPIRARGRRRLRHGGTPPRRRPVSGGWPTSPMWLASRPSTSIDDVRGRGLPALNVRSGRPVSGAGCHPKSRAGSLDRVVSPTVHAESRPGRSCGGAVQPMSRPFTVSLTSMLPRVALEYGHT